MSIGRLMLLDMVYHSLFGTWSKETLKDLYKWHCGLQTTSIWETNCAIKKHLGNMCCSLWRMLNHSITNFAMGFPSFAPQYWQAIALQWQNHRILPSGPKCSQLFPPLPWYEWSIRCAAIANTLQSSTVYLWWWSMTKTVSDIGPVCNKCEESNYLYLQW